MNEMRGKLIAVQSKLNAPKSQYNSFGKYSYRSCEDILEAVKPLLDRQGLYLTISDDIVRIGDRFYVKATATVSDGTEKISTTAYARERAEKKGMDESQITGAASSYARKYALNGLFCIDDNKDRDSMDNTGSGTKAARKAGQKQSRQNNTGGQAKAPGPAGGQERKLTWEEIAQRPEFQDAHCAWCGKPVSPEWAAKSYVKYKNIFCSGACKDAFYEEPEPPLLNHYGVEMDTGGGSGI